MTDPEQSEKKRGKSWITLSIVILVVLAAAVVGYSQKGLITAFITREDTNGKTDNQPEATIIKDGPNQQINTNENGADKSNLPQIEGIDAAARASREGLTSSLHLTLDLRDYYNQKNTIKTSETITRLNNEIKALQSPAVQEAWDTLALCIARGCNDDRFLDFINTLSIESNNNGMRNAQLTVDLTTAVKYWNTDNTIRLSEAITAVDAQVRGLNQPELQKSWQKIVDCNGKCATRTQLIFDFLKALG